MNLLKFLDAVDSLSQSLDKKQMTVFVHDIARVIPEYARGDFINRLKKCSCNEDRDSSHTLNQCMVEDKCNYERIKEKLTKIENCEICLSGHLNEEYDEWYNSDELSRINYKLLITDALYLAYFANSLNERPNALYALMQNAGDKDISIEKIMQCGEELLEFEEFLPIWTAYLGNKNSYIAQKLLDEAIELSNNSETLLSNAQIYYEQHPWLYEKYIKENRDKISVEEMILIGDEALKQIDIKYLVRSRIALLMADIILEEKDKVTRAVETYWLEAFRSDTRVVHYVRMMMECKDFSEWKEELQYINHNMAKKLKGRHIYHNKSIGSEENMPNIQNTYLIALLNGEYEYVKDYGMNYHGALGWSSSYMKQGLAAFLVILINGEKLSEGGRRMLSKIVSYVAFTTDEYRQGVSTEINETNMEWLWKCFLRSKELHPMTESNQRVYLEWIKILLKERVDAIMEGNHRNYYLECAEYIAALGEALESTGVLNGKQLLMLEYKQNYNRRSAFHKELRICGMKGEGRK